MNRPTVIEQDFSFKAWREATAAINTHNTIYRALGMRLTDGLVKDWAQINIGMKHLEASEAEVA